MITNKDSAINYIRIEAFIWEIFIKVREKARADFNGIMDRFMRASGKVVKSKEVEYGRVQMDYHM